MLTFPKTEMDPCDMLFLPTGTLMPIIRLDDMKEDKIVFFSTFKKQLSRSYFLL